MVIPFSKLPGALSSVAKALPSGALSQVLRVSLTHSGGASTSAWLILVGWAVVAPAAATRLFRWE